MTEAAHQEPADLEAWLAEKNRRGFAQDPPPVPMVVTEGHGVRKPEGRLLAGQEYQLRISTVNALMRRQHRRHRLAALAYVALGIAIGSGLVLAALVLS